MDITTTASQLISALSKNPNLVSQFAEHPYSTTAEVTGTNETISQKDMSRILTQVAAQASGQELGTNDTKDLASALLGQTGGVHALASALFGGAQGTSNQASNAGSIDLSSLVSSLSSTSSTSSNTNPSAGPSMAEIAAKSIAGAIAARGLAALLTTAMGTNKKNPAE